ncbi:putative antirepressor [Escherichia coli]|nr:putative antirepressor [Escherichia coli]
MQLEQQLVAAAPKVDFADRVSVANGILIGNFAKVVGLKQNDLFSWLRQNGILMAFGARKKRTTPTVHQRRVFHSERSGAG